MLPFANVAIFLLCRRNYPTNQLSNCSVQAQGAGFVSPRSGASVSFGPAARLGIVGAGVGADRARTGMRHRRADGRHGGPPRQRYPCSRGSAISVIPSFRHCCEAARHCARAPALPRRTLGTAGKSCYVLSRRDSLILLILLILSKNYQSVWSVLPSFRHCCEAARHCQPPAAGSSLLRSSSSLPRLRGSAPSGARHCRVCAAPRPNQPRQRLI